MSALSAPSGQMSALGEIRLVAGREIRTRLLSKATVISTLVILIVLVGATVALSIFSDRQATTVTQVGISAETAELTQTLEQVAAQQGLTIEVTQHGHDDGLQGVLDGDLEAHLSGEPRAPVVSVDGMPDGQLLNAIAAAAQQFALTEVIGGLGGDPAQVQGELAQAVPSVENVGEASGWDPVRFITAMVTVSLLLFALMQGTQLIAIGVVEEKSSRVVEILLATIRPSHLLAGKVLGIGFVALAQVTVFAVGLAVAAHFTGLLDAVDLDITAPLLWLAVWFFLGFGLYAVMMGGVASLVSRQEDIGSVTTPIILLLMLPFYLGIWLVPSSPDGTLTKVLSQIPFFAPFIMPSRQAFTDVPAIDLIVAIGGSLILIPVLVWLGGRIYSRAVLTTGGRMKLREALRS